MLREYAKPLHHFLFVSDILVSSLLFVGFFLHQEIDSSAGIETRFLQSILFALGLMACLIWPLGLDRLGFYRSHRCERYRRIVEKLLVADSGSLLMMSAIVFMLNAPISPYFPVLFCSAHFLCMAGLRIGAVKTVQSAHRSGRNHRNIVVIGTGPRALMVKRELENHAEWGFEIVAFVDKLPLGYKALVPKEQICDFSEVPGLLKDHIVDEVVAACPRDMLPDLIPIVEACSTIGVPLTLLSDIFGDRLPQPRINLYGSLGGLSFAPVHHGEVDLALKRLMDIVASATLLFVSAPIILLSSLAISISDPGPVLFRQIRVGRNGRKFEILKLRTMCINAEEKKEELEALNEMDGPVFKIKNDPRIFSVGRFLRKWSFDELPQLWNVLRGEMSLVGPRPPTPGEVEKYRPTDRRRLSMRPGLTCIWQISGRNQIGFREWMKLDLFYIDTWSLANDVRILLKTIPAVLKGEGAS